MTSQAHIDAWKACINSHRSETPWQGPLCELRNDRRQNISQVVAPGRITAFDGNLPGEFLESVFAAARDQWRASACAALPPIIEQEVA